MHSTLLRRAILLAFALCGLLIGSGCSVSKDFEFELQREFAVLYDGTTYAVTQSVDATQLSDDFDTHQDEIDNVRLLGASYLVTQFTGTATQEIVSATLKVGGLSETPTEVVASVSNVNLQGAAAGEQELTLNDAGKTKVEDLIGAEPFAANLSFEGSVNEAPVNFHIRFTLRMKATYTKKLT